MHEDKKAKLILKILNKVYPTTSIPLKHTNNFTLLISVLFEKKLKKLVLVSKRIQECYLRLAVVLHMTYCT